MHSTEQAILAAAKALWAGVHVSILKRALVSDGFAPQKADVIIRWAHQFYSNYLHQCQNTTSTVGQ